MKTQHSPETIDLPTSSVVPIRSDQETGATLSGAEHSVVDVALKQQCAEFRALDQRLYRIHRFYLCTQPLFLGLPLLLSLMLNTLSRGKYGGGLSLCLAFVPWLGMVGWALVFGGRMDKLLRTQAKALTASGDLCVIGPLIDARCMTTTAGSAIVGDGLITLLPLLPPEDTTLLTAKQRSRLCERLAIPLQKAPQNLSSLQQEEYERALALRIAILQALTYFGDGEAMPIVTRLANQEACSEAERGVQEAARTCLDAISRRVEQQRDPLLLLRASSAVDNDGQTLLRTVTDSAAEARPEQLLRPGLNPSTTDRRERQIP